MDRPVVRRLLVAAVLIGAGLAAFGRLTLNPTGILVGPQRGGLNDLTDYFLPQTEYKILAWRKHGAPPTWDPHLQLGRPIVGNPQSALYYPATWLMLATGQSRLASWLLVAHHIFGGWGMYLLCRRYGFARPAALVGGITFLAAPPFAAHTAAGHVTMTSAAAWIPWALVSYERLRRGRPYAIVMLGAVLALAFFAGHTQTTYYLVAALCAFAAIDVVRGFLVSKHEGETVAPGTLATHFVLAGMLTAGLVAIDLLPIWLTSQQTTRVLQGLTADESGKMGATFPNLVQLIFPFGLGKPAEVQASGHNYWETLLYVGVVPLLLAILAVASRARHYPTGRYVALFLVVLLFSLSDATPFYAFLHHYLPGVATFRVPSRAMIYAAVAVSVLAAAGVHQLAAWCERNTPAPGRSTLLRGGAFVVLIVTGAELAWHTWAVTRIADRGQLRTQSKLTQLVNASSASYRVLASHDLLSDEEVYRHDFAKVSGYDPFLFVRFGALLQATLDGRSFLQGEAPGAVVEGNLHYDRAVLQFLGTRYAMLPRQPEQLPAGWQMIEKGTLAPPVVLRGEDATSLPYFVYENENPLPRAFVVGRTIAGRDLSMIDPTTTLLIPPGAPPGDARQALAPATIVEYGPARVVIEAELAAPGYLVLSDIHALGWQATANGQPVPIVPVNLGLRGVHLPAGQHRVEMTFSPPLWTPGLAVSLASLAIAVYLVVKEKRGPAGDERKGAA